MRGTGYGLLGAFIGDWLLLRLSIHLGSGTVALIANATTGEIVLILMIRLLAGRGWSGAGWGRQCNRACRPSSDTR